MTITDKEARQKIARLEDAIKGLSASSPVSLDQPPKTKADNSEMIQMQDDIKQVKAAVTQLKKGLEELRENPPAQRTFHEIAKGLVDLGWMPRVR
jgi:hypothetical protein